MKNARADLEAYLQEHYFRTVPLIKAHGSTTIEGFEENLRTFLETIPDHITLDDTQYEAVTRWLNAELLQKRGLTQPTEIALLTYINSCYASRHIQ